MCIPDEVPEEIKEGGVGAVVGFMLQKGFSKKEHGQPAGPWEQSQYRTESSTCFDVSYNTFLKILKNQVVSERSVRNVATSLTKSLPEGHTIREKWIECAVNQPQVKKTSPIVTSTARPSRKANELMSLDGVWVYILRRHNAGKFLLANSADYIVGVFQCQNCSIYTAYNYGYLAEQERIVRYRNWSATDCGVGLRSVFIPFRNEYYNTATKEAGVSGIIYAKYDGLQTVKTGRMAIKGYYYDTNTGLVEDGGEFYAEQYSQSVDSTVEVTAEIARALSEAF
ncbi:hypothetical protein [Roseovarius phycicola]|uniref:Uncharacterized protein n=1 Tax=Roseovarius phycicola TaxID=3080976 RepID=A0ABZ2HIN5_9RHOB